MSQKEELIYIGQTAAQVILVFTLPQILLDTRYPANRWLKDKTVVWFSSRFRKGKIESPGTSGWDDLIVLARKRAEVVVILSLQVDVEY